MLRLRRQRTVGGDGKEADVVADSSAENEGVSDEEEKEGNSLSGNCNDGDGVAAVRMRYRLREGCDVGS